MNHKAMSGLSSIKKQAGVSNITIIVGLVIAGLVAAFALKVLVPSVQSTTQNGAFDELHMITSSVRDMKLRTGSFALLTNFEVLTDRAYIDSPVFTDGVNQNVYGLSVTAVRASGNATATVTYAFRDNPQCLNMIDRLTQIAFLSGSACASGVLTTTVS